MADQLNYSVPGIHCAHCVRAVTDEVSAVPGVRAVDVDPDSKVVVVSGRDLDDEQLRAAIAEAGYEAA